MLQYQLSMTLADMRIRELVAQAERRALVKAARRDSTDTTTTLTTRVKHAADRILASFHAPREASVSSTRTSMTGAGPIGCST